MKLTWHPEAGEDVREAAAWYEAHDCGMGREFTETIALTADRIGEFGGTFAISDPADPIRICPVSRFPYHILFRVDGDVTQILCVKHNRRHPNYGVDRR